MHGSAVAKEQTNNQKKKRKKKETEITEAPDSYIYYLGRIFKKIITLNLVLLASKSKK